MIGAILYRLRALNEDSLPLFAGQLLHGLVFNIFEKFSPALAKSIHSKKNIKPFTLKEFELQKSNTNNNSKKYIKNNRRYIDANDVVFWRVTALNDDVLQAFLAIKTGEIFEIGKLKFSVENIFIDSNLREDIGLIDSQNMVNDFLYMTNISPIISMNFISVTSFKTDIYDYPFPTPQLIFASLSDKWNAMNMPLEISSKIIREISKNIIPDDWHGKSQKITLSKNRSAKGFIGKFNYNLTGLNNEFIKIIMLLAAYAEFSGVGRWTAHGLGQTRINLV